MLQQASTNLLQASIVTGILASQIYCLVQACTRLFTGCYQSGYHVHASANSNVEIQNPDFKEHKIPFKRLKNPKNQISNGKNSQILNGLSPPISGTPGLSMRYILKAIDKQNFECDKILIWMLLPGRTFQSDMSMCDARHKYSWIKKKIKFKTHDILIHWTSSELSIHK